MLVFVTCLHSESSVNFIFKPFLPPYGCSHRQVWVSWEERPASQSTLGTTVLSQPSVLKAVYFYPAHFSTHMTGWAAKMICLHLCHVPGPFINCQTSEFMDGTSVPVSFYARVTHKRKGLPSPQEATWEVVVNLTYVYGNNPPSPHPAGNYIPFYTPKFFWGLPSLFFWCVGQAISPSKRVSRESKLFSPSKIIWKLVCDVFLHFWAPEFSLSAEWVLLMKPWLCQLAKPNSCRSQRTGKGLKSGCSRKK